MTPQDKPAPPEVRQRVDEEPDFVALRHHDNSLKVLMSKYPDGVPAHIKARALGRTERQVAALWCTIVRRARGLLGVEKR